MERFCEALERLDARAKITERGYSTQYDKLYELCRNIDLIEKELGIPLEVLFKALKEGVWVKEDIWNNNYKIINFGYVINEYCIYNNDFARSTKDYGKTWWLEKPEVNENE